LARLNPWRCTSRSFLAKYLRRYSQRFLPRPAQEASSLTEEERGIVRLIAEGQTNKEIAKLLNIALKSVETRRAAVMKKLGLSYSAELVRYAIRNGLVEP